jgi:hypothetical protein
MMLSSEPTWRPDEEDPELEKSLFPVPPPRKVLIQGLTDSKLLLMI